MLSSPLLPNTKFAENHIEQILDIDSASDAPKRTQSKPQIFGAKRGFRRRKGADKVPLRLLQRGAMTGTSQGWRGINGKPAGNGLGQALRQQGQIDASRRRNRQRR